MGKDNSELQKINTSSDVKNISKEVPQATEKIQDDVKKILPEQLTYKKYNIEIDKIDKNIVIRKDDQEIDIQTLRKTDQISIFLTIIDESKETSEKKEEIILKNANKFSSKNHFEIIKILLQKGYKVENLKRFNGIWESPQKLWSNIYKVLEIDSKYAEYFKKEISRKIIPFSLPLNKLEPQEQQYCLHVLRKIKSYSPEIIKELSNSEKEIKNMEEMENRETIEMLFDVTLIESSKKINEGQMGTIHLITPQELIEALEEKCKKSGIFGESEKKLIHQLLQEYFGEDYEDNKRVIKMLKIFDRDAGKEEFKAHQKVYNLIHKKTGEYAKIPKIYLAKEKKVNPKLKNHFDKKSNSVFFLTMDYINGNDFLTHIFSKILESENKLSKNMTFEDMQLEIKNIIPWKDPNHFGTFNNEAERENAKKEAGTENIQELKRYCTKTGIHIPKNVYTKIENTLDELHHHNWYHRDLHSRNIMFEYDENQNIKDVFIIDFGTTKHVENETDAYRDEDVKYPQDKDILHIISNFTN